MFKCLQPSHTAHMYTHTQGHIHTSTHTHGHSYANTHTPSHSHMHASTHTQKTPGSQRPGLVELGRSGPGPLDALGAISPCCLCSVYTVKGTEPHPSLWALSRVHSRSLPSLPSPGIWLRFIDSMHIYRPHQQGKGIPGKVPQGATRV